MGNAAALYTAKGIKQAAKKTKPKKKKKAPQGYTTIAQRLLNT